MIGTREVLTFLREAIAFHSESVSALDNYAQRGDQFRISFVMTEAAIERTDEVLEDLITTIERLARPTVWANGETDPHA